MRLVGVFLDHTAVRRTAPDRVDSYPTRLRSRLGNASRPEEESMHRVRMFAVVAALLLPAAVAAQSTARPVVIRASTVLDGKGGLLRDVAQEAALSNDQDRK